MSNLAFLLEAQANLIDENVYRKGFKAEFSGNINTATQADTTAGINTPFKAIKLSMIIGIQQRQSEMIIREIFLSNRTSESENDLPDASRDDPML